jgi:hypothetical protein
MLLNGDGLSRQGPRAAGLEKTIAYFDRLLAASAHPITHIFPRPSQHLAKSLISKDLFRSQATCQDSS